MRAATSFEDSLKILDGIFKVSKENRLGVCLNCQIALKLRQVEMGQEFRTGENKKGPILHNLSTLPTYFYHGAAHTEPLYPFKV